VTSAHVRRLRSRVARTAARFTRAAAETNASVADLPNLKLPWYVVRNQAEDGTEGETTEATILIFDEIGGSFGISADDFVRDLEEIDAPTINVRINSPGGSLFDAIAMYNALNHHPANIVTYVDSLAASAASVVAMAGDEIVMMPGSQMMIHDASTTADGDSAEMSKIATFLDRQSENVAGIYQMRAGGDVGKWRALMLDETWAFADEAVELGLADRVEQPPARPEPMEADGEDVEMMKRSFDLTQFRYAGRERAPGPMQTRTGNATQRRGRGVVREPNIDARAAGQARAKAATVTDGHLKRSMRSAEAPSGSTRMVAFPATLRAQTVDFKGKQMHKLTGTATVFNREYQMWDDFGPYKERVSDRAPVESLAANPDVAFLVNHKGITMARTKTGTLLLASDSTSLPITAYLNPDRSDVQTLMSAVDDGLVDEMSFAFELLEGEWNDDFTVFTITRLSVDRGDVSAVNYGANPYTSIAARSQEIITRELDLLPAGAAQAAMARLQARSDVRGTPVLSKDTVDALGTRIGSAVQQVLQDIAETTRATRAIVDAPPTMLDDETEPRPEVTPVAEATGRSLDAAAALLASLEAKKIGARP
jgi:HK97 family phage prohead protease